MKSSSTREKYLQHSSQEAPINIDRDAALKMDIILFIYDEMLRQILFEFLINLKMKPVIAECIEQINIDISGQTAKLVITDRFQGKERELFRQLHHQNPASGVVAVMDVVPSLSADQSLDYGIYRCLCKPVSLAEVECIIYKYMENKARG